MKQNQNPRNRSHDHVRQAYMRNAKQHTPEFLKRVRNWRFTQQAFIAGVMLQLRQRGIAVDQWYRSQAIAGARTRYVWKTTSPAMATAALLVLRAQ